MERHGILGWFDPDNLAGLLVSMGVALSTASCVALVRGTTGKALAASHLSAGILCGVCIPIAATRFGLTNWQDWLGLAFVLGATSLLIIGALVKIAERVQGRATDIADAALDRVLPGTPKGPQP